MDSFVTDYFFWSPSTEKQKIRTEITSLEEMLDIFCTYKNLL